MDIGGVSFVIEFGNAKVLKTSDGQPLRGLEIGTIGAMESVAGKNIRIEENRIIIERCGTVQRVRYAWKPYTDANLVNEEGLPASTFEITVRSQN